MLLSIVTTLYKSAPHLEEFYERLTAAARTLGKPYEIVFVNDGSPDDSLAIALDIQRRDHAVRIIDLSRNFGHHAALRTGLRHARGERVFLLDSDLEEDPALLLRFWHEQVKSGADVVYGVQDARRGSWCKRWGGWGFYKLFNWLSSVPLPENLMTVRLMSRRYLDALLLHREVACPIAGLWALTGFEQRPLTIEKGCKRKTTYSLSRQVSLLINAITAFTDKPLVFTCYMGLCVFLFSLCAAVGLVFRWLFFGEILAGWSSIMVSIWLFSGLIIFIQGVLGIYLCKIYLEAKHRPTAIVRQIHEVAEEPGRESVKQAG